MSENWKLQVSLKFGPRGEHMANVRGESPADLAFNIKALSDLDDVIAEALGLLSGGSAAPAPAQPTHDQAVANVQAAIPQASVAYDSAPAPAAPIATVGAPAPQGGPLYELTDKYNRVFTYNVPGAPQTPRGPALMMKATSQKGTPYKKWVDPCTGPEWFTQRKPRVDKAEQWEGEFIRG